MTIHKNDQASVRIWAHNPDHHLYNNNGTWWLHYTAYPTPLTTQRMRRSLKTRDVTLARSRRDAVLAQLHRSQQRSLIADETELVPPQLHRSQQRSLIADEAELIPPQSTSVATAQPDSGRGGARPSPT